MRLDELEKEDHRPAFLIMSTGAGRESRKQERTIKATRNTVTKEKKKLTTTRKDYYRFSESAYAGRKKKTDN